MIKKITLSTAIAVSALTAMPAAAQAQSRDGYSSRYDDGYYNQGQRYDRRYDGRYDRRYDNRRYQNQRYQNQRYGNHYGQRCGNGSTGTILGAIAGGLLGREVAGRGDRTVGTIIGGGRGRRSPAARSTATTAAAAKKWGQLPATVPRLPSCSVARAGPVPAMGDRPNLPVTRAGPHSFNPCPHLALSNRPASCSTIVPPSCSASMIVTARW